MTSDSKTIKKEEKTMNANGFREDELVSRKVKINGDWQTRMFPVVGGRLRLAHEQNENLSLQTKLVSWDGQYAVFKCCAVTGKGSLLALAPPTAKETPGSQKALWSWRKHALLPVP